MAKRYMRILDIPVTFTVNSGQDLNKSANRTLRKTVLPGRPGYVPPQDQGVVESCGGAQAIVKSGGDRKQPGELSPEQGLRVSPGPVEQRELDHQLGPDVSGVFHRRAQPRGRGPLSGRSRLVERADRPRAGPLLPHRLDQAEKFQPLQGAVDRPSSRSDSRGRG